MNYKILNLTLAAVLLSGSLLLTKQAIAAVRCETQYGGGEVCVKTGELQIDKEVWDIQDAEYVDNLFVTDYVYTNGEEIIFKLKIKNVGDENFEKVEVRDYLPSYLELIEGDLSFEIRDLAVDETEEKTIKAKVVGLPDNTNLCEVNTAEVWSGDEHDKDSAQICLGKKVLGVAVTPVTGPENGLLVLFLATLAGIAGVSFLKLSKADKSL